MYICPNTNLPEWKLLVKKAGSYDAAFDVFIQNQYEVPTEEQINALYKYQSTIDASPEAIKNQLISTGFFRNYNNQVLVKNKNTYSQAIAEVGKINKQVPGLVKLAKTPIGWSVQVTEGQQELFDLPSPVTNKLLLPGFKSFYQQKEAVDVISSSVLGFIRDNPTVKTATFKQAIKNFEEKLTAVNAATPKDIYKTILDNLDPLSVQARRKLQLLNLIGKPKLEGTDLTKTVETTEKVEEEGVEEVEAIGAVGKDEWVFQYDSKDNALKTVKKFLAFVPKTVYKEDTNEFKLVQSVVPGQPSFMSYDEVYEQLKAVLAGVTNTWEAVEAELLKHTKGKPFIHSVLKRINTFKEDKEQLKRQFVSSMSSSYSGFKTILIKDKRDREGNKIGQYFNVIDTDQSAIEKTILTKWQGEFTRSGFYKNVEGNLEINQEAVDDYRKALEEAKANPTAEKVDGLLQAVGITLSSNTLNQLVTGIVNRSALAGQFANRGGLFKLIDLRLSGKTDEGDQREEEDEVAIDNPLTNNSAVRALAKLESYNTDYYYSNTFKDGEGNTVYSYTFNKFLTKEFTKLLTDENHVKNLLNITFNKPIYAGENPTYQTWLYQLANEPAFKSVFNISPLDTLRLSGNFQTGTKLTSMSELDLELTQLALIQNSGQRKKGLGTHKDGARIIKYLLTVPSKTTSYAIQGIGQDVKLFFDQDGYRIDKETRNALYSIAASEHNRILAQQSRTSDNSAYNKGSKLFYFFPTLNAIVINKDKTIKLPTDKLTNSLTVEEAIRNEIDRIVKKDIQDKISQWQKLGIASDRLLLIDANYEAVILHEQTTDINKKLTLAAADYVINSMLAKFNTHQTFIDDPAVYFKKNVKDTWDNIGKRLTNLIAPFKDGMIDENNKNFLSIKLADRKAVALNNAQLQARLSKYYEENNIALPYDNIVGTDAAEYVTLKEELAVMYMYGEITTELYNSLLTKTKEQGDNLVLTKEELQKTVFLPRKPVYSSRIVSKDDDVVYREYIKSASIALLPQFTKGLEIDKLRVGMEKLEISKGLTVRAVFDSGTKIGGKGSIDIWNKDGSIKADLDLTSNAVVLERSNFGIQQEVPYDESKDETVRSTQVLKGLFDSLNEVGGFRYNQKVYTGEELNKLYVELQQKLYEKGLASLEKRILNKDGQLAKAEVIDLLRNEGIKRNYSPAQLSFLEVNRDKTDFELPFWAHTNNDKEQAMLTSLWTNKVLKQKMPGGSYVLVSEEGMQGKSLGTLYTKDYNPNTGLKPMRIVYKKDTVQLEEEDYRKLSKADQEGYREIVKPAQVLVTWNIRDKVGKLLDRSKFINEEGFLDTTKIPKDLLTQFGFRIPNQGHNSMGLIEIVGFLPETYQGIVIATRNFITQMGSDFDVDKLYVYSYYLQVNDGVISRTDDPQNALVDIHKSVLYNPKVFNSVVKPLDLGRIKYETTDGKIQGIAQQIKEQQEKTTENYLNPDYSKGKYLQSVDGKAMVGLTSTSNVFSTLLQNKNVFLQKQITIGDKTQWIPDHIVFADSKGKELKLSNISSPYTVTGRKKNEVHQGIQSAAVDNEKDPVLSYINVSPATSSVLTQLIDLGLEEEEIYGFLAQPILVEYATKVKLSKSSVNETKREEEILAELEQTQKTILDSLKVKLKTDQLADFPLGVQDFNQVLFRQAVGELTNEEIQALVLAKFVKIKQYGDILQRAQNLLNIESKGVGKGLLDLADKRRAIDKALNIASFANLHKIVGELEDGHVIPETITGFGLVNSIYAADDTVTNAGLMPFSTNQFDEVVQQYEDIINRDSTAEQKYEIWKAVKAYTYSKFLGQDERQRVFFDKGTNKSLNTRITELLKTKLKHNEFILRLDLSKIDITGNNPSHVFYNASKEADIEEINTYQGLYELVFNEDAEIRGIGQDLIRYFYLNGGNQSAKDWGRFISRDMLDQVGLTEFIRTVDFNQADTYGYKVGLSDVLLQMFQHKSYLAPKLKETIGIVKTKGEIKVIQSTIPRELVRGLGLVPVFNSDGNLYTLAKQDAEGNYIYNLTPPLGKKFFSEFQQSNQYSEITKSKATQKVEVGKPINIQDKSEQKIMPNDQPLAVYQNPIIGDEFVGLLNTDVNEALASIQTTKYNEEIAKLFIRLKPIIGNVQIEAVQSDEFYFGRWDQKTIRINIQQLQDRNNLTRRKVEEEILKELVHVLNTKVFRQEGFTPTTEQIQARTAINTLFTSLRDRVVAGELTQWDKGTLVKFEEILGRLRKKDIISPADKDFLTSNKAKYYGLTNVEDFLHESLLEPEFRDIMNSINYSTGKSLLDRFSDLIFQILDGFRELVGVKQDTALEEAFYQLINLTEIKNKNNIIFEEDKSQGYRERTIKNASADATLALAIDFTSAGEILTKNSVLNQKKIYIPVNANDLSITDERVNNIVNELNKSKSSGNISLNIAGNGIYTMKGRYTQEEIDNFTFALLKQVLESSRLNVKVTSIRTGGQTGFDEAGAKAGNKLGINTKILAPNGWKYRNINGVDISNKASFKARFGIDEKDINIGEQQQIFYDLVEDSIKDKEEKNYKGIIDDFAVRLKRISDDIGKAYAAKDTELITALKNRLEEVQAERDNLIADNTVETLIAQAENDFTYVENLFKKPDISDNDLAYIKLVLGTWTKVGNPEIYDVLTSFDLRMQTPKKVRIQQIVDKARGLQDILNQVNIDILKTQAEEELGRKVSRKQLTTLSDISSAQASFRDITSSNNVILDVVDKWVRKSEFKATTELNELIEEAEKLTKALNTKGIKSREDFAEVFGQLNEKGELTGEIVDALSHHYHATRNALNDAMTYATSPENKKIASVIYYNWIRDNHILLDPAKLFKENVDGIFEESEDKAYLSIMEEQLGEDYAKTVANAKVLIAEYNEELKQQIAYYKDNVDGHKKLEVWRLENSPLIYLDNLVNGLTIRKVEGVTIYNKGWKYVAKRVKPEWEDNKYNEIQKDADKKAYYDWYRGSLKDLYNYLPYNIRKELKYTEIPNIEKELVQEIHDAGMAKIANRTWSSLLDNISVSKNEPQGLIDPSTRGLEKEFRFAYIEKLNPKYKSYDLTQTLKLFAAQAIAYKFKSQVEDQIRLADSVLKEALEQQVKSNGEVVTDKFGRTTSVKGLENLRKQLDYAIDAYYGNKKDTREGKTNINFITPKDKERLQAEVAEINELDIPQVSKDIMIQKATDKYTKSLTWSKVGDTLLQYAQLKGMGWNIFGGVNNALFGQVANYNWSATGVDFSDSDMNKAVGIMLKAQSPVDSDEKTKIEALMIKFNTVKQLRDKIYNSTTNYNKARQGMKKLLPYELYAQGEYFVQGQVMVAMLNAQKVKVTEDGVEKEIPLYEALDNEGNWNSVKFGENTVWSKLGKSTMDFKFKLDTLLKKIHGNYDPQSAILINKKFFGRALIQFRRWIPEGVAQRFDSEKYDNYLQRTTKGRYSTYYDLGWKNSAKVLLKSAITRGSDKAFEGLGYEGVELELVKENMKKNLREIYFKLSLMGMYIMLSGLDDEDETQRKLKNYSINTVLRLQDDIEFYYSPIAFDNITRSALPVTNIIVDFAKFSDAFLDTMNGEGTYKSGIHSGDSKLLWRGAKLLPFTSTVAGLINKGENAENFRK